MLKSLLVEIGVSVQFCVPLKNLFQITDDSLSLTFDFFKSPIFNLLMVVCSKYSLEADAKTYTGTAFAVGQFMNVES